MLTDSPRLARIASSRLFVRILSAVVLLGAALRRRAAADSDVPVAPGTWDPVD